MHTKCSLVLVSFWNNGNYLLLSICYSFVTDWATGIGSQWGTMITLPFVSLPWEHQEHRPCMVGPLMVLGWVWPLKFTVASLITVWVLQGLNTHSHELVRQKDSNRWLLFSLPYFSFHISIFHTFWSSKQHFLKNNEMVTCSSLKQHE